MTTSRKPSPTTTKTPKVTAATATKAAAPRRILDATQAGATKKAAVKKTAAKKTAAAAPVAKKAAPARATKAAAKAAPAKKTPAKKAAPAKATTEDNPEVLDSQVAAKTALRNRKPGPDDVALFDIDEPTLGEETEELDEELDSELVDTDETIDEDVVEKVVATTPVRDYDYLADETTDEDEVISTAEVIEQLHTQLGLAPLLDSAEEEIDESETSEDIFEISAADLAIRDLAELDDFEAAGLREMASIIAEQTATMTFEDYDFEWIVADLNLNDVSGSYATLEAYRPPFVAAATAAQRKNPGAEFYNHVNPPLFNRRIELRSLVADLEARDELSIGDEIDLARAKGTLDSLTSLIVRLNYGMTRNYVRQFTSNTSKEDSADFQAAATLGLMVAIDSFDPSRGKFGSWAYKPIQRAVLKSVREADYKNLNEGDFEKRPKVLKAFRELVEERGEDAPAPTHFEVAERAGVHHALAKRVLAAPHLDSIHARVGDEGSSELGDLIPDTAAAFEDQVISAMDVSALMEYGMTELDPREHYVLVRVFGLDGEEPDALSDIGSWLGLSREAARQIRGKGLAKLLHPITLRKLVRGGRD